MILSSGDSYEIRYPEFASLVKVGLYVGLPTAKNSNGHADLPKRAVFCSALDLAGVEQLVG